jgi:hypothetical protein
MLDSLNRFAIVFIAVIGLLSSQTQSASIVFEVIAHVLSAIAFFTAAAMLISSIPPLQRALRNFRQEV